MAIKAICRSISVVPVYMTVFTISCSVSAHEPETYACMFEIQRHPCYLPVTIIAERAELIQVRPFMAVDTFGVKAFKAFFFLVAF